MCVSQLRECLEPEVYELFHKKLTEQALIKDPKFLWCSHVSLHRTHTHHTHTHHTHTHHTHDHVTLVKQVIQL